MIEDVPPQPARGRGRLYGTLAFLGVLLLCVGAAMWFVLGGSLGDKPDPELFPQSYKPTVPVAESGVEYVLPVSDGQDLCRYVDPERVDAVLDVVDEPSGDVIGGEGFGHATCTLTLEHDGGESPGDSYGRFDVRVIVEPGAEDAARTRELAAEAFTSTDYEPVEVSGLTEEAVGFAKRRDDGVDAAIVARNGNMVVQAGFNITSDENVPEEVLLNVSIDTINDVMSQLA
ncbi:MAG: hypothetical protein ACRDXX_08720 [Stackebrandtia sp.]